MTDDIKDEQVKNTKELIKTLQGLGVEPFLWAGSLLGAIRDSDIITDDSDMDIAYVSKYHEAQDIINETIELYSKLSELGLLHDYLDEEFQLVRAPKDIRTVFGQAHIGTIYPYLDLFTMWTSGDTFYDPWFGPVAQNIDTTVVQDNAELRGVKFPTLKNPEWILEMLYGTQWGTPAKDKGTNRHYFKHALKEFRTGVV